jgi:hypothetical protein
MKSDTEWHLDKRVPLGIILTLVAQTITLVYIGTSWKSDIDHRLTSVEVAQVATAPQERRITILEQQWTFISDTLKRIEVKIDRVDLRDKPR